MPRHKERTESDDKGAAEGPPMARFRKLTKSLLQVELADVRERERAPKGPKEPSR